MYSNKWRFLHSKCVKNAMGVRPKCIFWALVYCENEAFCLSESSESRPTRLWKRNPRRRRGVGNYSNRRFGGSIGFVVKVARSASSGAASVSIATRHPHRIASVRNRNRLQIQIFFSMSTFDWCIKSIPTLYIIFENPRCWRLSRLRLFFLRGAVHLQSGARWGWRVRVPDQSAWLWCLWHRYDIGHQLPPRAVARQMLFFVLERKTWPMCNY